MERVKLRALWDFAIPFSGNDIDARKLEKWKNKKMHHEVMHFALH